MRRSQRGKQMRDRTSDQRRTPTAPHEPRRGRARARARGAELDELRDQQEEARFGEPEKDDLLSEAPALVRLALRGFARNLVARRAAELAEDVKERVVAGERGRNPQKRGEQHEQPQLQHAQHRDHPLPVNYIRGRSE